MSDQEVRNAADSTYVNTLKSQIAEKKELLQVAKDELQKAGDKSQIDDPKKEVLSLMEVLKRLPYIPPRNDTIGVSLAKAQLTDETESLDRLIKQLKEVNVEELEAQTRVHAKLSVLYDRVNDFLNEDIAKKESEIQKRHNLKQNSKAIDNLIEGKYAALEKHIGNLRARSLKLTEFTRILVEEYILKSEIPVFESDEQIRHKKRKFLQLLELLLNNKLMSSQEGREKTILVASKDDSLIRYLLVNNIATVDKRDSNRIRLMM